MATTYTTNAKLPKFAFGDTSWHVPVIAATNAIDALTPVSGLCVTPAQIPSSTLSVAVSGGTYRQASGAVATFAGNASYAVLASSTRNLWLTDSGTLMAGAAWPDGPHVRLARVVTGTTTITSVADARLSGVVAGGGMVVATSTKTAAYSITVADGEIRADATTATFVLTLPDAATCPGQIFRVMKTTAANTVTIGTTASQTINGATTLALTTQWTGKTIISNGTSWTAY